MLVIKRLIYLGSLIALLSSIVQVQASFHQGTSVVNVINATSSFDPTLNQTAVIDYTVLGPDPATEVMIRIYRAAATTGLRRCNDLPNNLVGTIDGPITRQTGSYTATWFGNVSAGLYCYQLRWGNPPLGANALIEGLITLTRSGGTGGTPGGIGVTPGTGGTSTSGEGTLPTVADIQFMVMPDTIDLARREEAVISYTVNRRFTTGLIVQIKFGNNTVRSLYFTNQPVEVGNYQHSWNGRYSDNTPVSATATGSAYRYVFISGGREIGSGSITVRDSSLAQPTLVPQLDISNEHANPNPFNADERGTEIKFTINKAAYVTVSITKPDDSPIKTLATNEFFPAARDISFPWNGTNQFNEKVTAGTYKFRIAAQAGLERDSFVGEVVVQRNAPIPTSFVSSIRITPRSFNPSRGEIVRIEYTLARSVNNFRITVRGRGQYTSLVHTIQTAQTKSGTDSSTWDGYFPYTGIYYRLPDLAPAGDYTFVFEATNESPVTDTVTVVFAPIPSVPVITDLGPNPNPFEQPCTTSYSPSQLNVQAASLYGCGTLLRYQLNQDARVDITILSGNATVRRLLVSSFSNNGFAAVTNLVFWDGRSELGHAVGDGTYTYYIEAHNSNGTAQTRTGTVTIRRSDPPPVVVPIHMDVYNAYADPPIFTPDSPHNQRTQIRFSLNQLGFVTVTITRGNGTDAVLVKTLVKDGDYTQGTNFAVTWDGSDKNGVLVPSGTYNFRIDAHGVGNNIDVAIGSVTVVRVGVPTPPSGIDVHNLTVTPDPFNPDTQSLVNFNFALNQSGYVTVSVRRSINGDLIRMLVNNQLFASGNNVVTWDGTYIYQLGYQQKVPADSYSVHVTVYSSIQANDTDSASRQFVVNRSGSPIYTPPTPPVAEDYTITDYGPQPQIFNPHRDQTTRIDFVVKPSPSQVQVNIYRGEVYIKQLPVFHHGSNFYSAQWNGREGGRNQIVADGTYTYKIEARAGGTTLARSGTVYVRSESINVSPSPYDYEPPRLPPPPRRRVIRPSTCGGFRDVPDNHSLCRALDFVRSRGIFMGYADGTFGLDRVIQRAELLAVIQKAFQFPLEPYDPYVDFDLGYRDLKKKTNQWYMPYLKTFSNLRIMVGYPNGRMRPKKTMSTAELYLVFFKAAKKSPLDITRFTLQNDVKRAPFIDTPITRETGWYMKYAAFARLNDLVKTERFYPGRGITRGQVVQLIYDTHRKGLISYGPQRPDSPVNYYPEYD